MRRWSEKEIVEWGEATFGVPTEPYRLIFRAIDEYKELIEEVEKEADTHDAVIAEIADVVIVLTQAVHRLGGSLEESIDDKMDINSMRSWVKTGDGVGQHQ